jgi:hypothetical protein
MRMGAYAFVINALGTLSSNPKTKPTSHPGHGKATQPITNPMAKRLAKAASKAVVLSGNDMGSISPTDTAPKINPLIIPCVKFDMPAISNNRRLARQDFDTRLCRNWRVELRRDSAAQELRRPFRCERLLSLNWPIPRFHEIASRSLYIVRCGAGGVAEALFVGW